MSSVKHNRLKLTDLPVVTSDFSILVNASTQQKNQASDITNSAQLGWSASISSSGTTSALGAKGLNTSTGAVYVFTKNSSDIWSQKQKLTASDAATTALLGYSTSINALGNIIISGARGEDTGGINAGAAYIFTKNSSDIWSQKQKIVSSDLQAYDFFGTSAAVSGDGNTTIVGAPYEDTGGVNAGAAYIFTKNSSDIWSQRQKIQSSDIAADDRFGRSVSIDNNGSLAVVGASSKNSSTGAAYVFTKNSSDIWSQKQKLTASDASSPSSFGISSSVNKPGNAVVITAEINGAIASFAGAAYIFTKNSSDIWSQKQKIVSSDLQANDFFGTSSTINYAGDIVMIGAQGEDTGFSNAGATYIFSKNASDLWDEQKKLQASDAATNRYFGSSVAIDNTGKYGVVGAFIGDAIGAGAAYHIKNTFDYNTSPGTVVIGSLSTGSLFRPVSDFTLRIKI